MKILMITVAKMDKGGIESYLMSLVRNFDHKNIHVDFVVHRQEKGGYEEEINSWGSKIYKLPRLSKHPIKYVKELLHVIKSGGYDIVHRHATASVMWIDLAIAKWAGVNIRIAHSHSSNWRIRWLHYLFRPLLKHYATDCFACSEKAGRWMYGDNRFVVMHNGIHIPNFTYSSAVREQYRKILNLETKRVIIHVGRLVPVKNHEWIIQIAEEMKNENVIFLFAGDGQLKQHLETMVKDKNLQEKVLFLGKRNDISGLMMASDVLLLPSKFEGMPVTLIEAQCCGLPCIVSENVTKEVDMGLVSFLPYDLLSWKNMIMEIKNSDSNRKNAYLKIEENNYSDNATARIMLAYYYERYQKIKERGGDLE
ncbi:MAG: glycosyltransferase family 1 protein [Lachnospiraceae bacterium]|jgi:glycosyltransferase involved in cell wall biosynthesis|nr:glycosyltransferase family 1 protein [Lachnospiraceae bacterium]